MGNCRLCLLSPVFFARYPEFDYPEIERKANRPYAVIVLDIDGTCYGIPFRSNVKHRFCYPFSNTGRTTNSKTALDYSKAVIISDSVYLGAKAYIDKKEFQELNTKIGLIKKQFGMFVSRYKKYNRDPIKYSRELDQLSFCTLQYFKKELGL